MSIKINDLQGEEGGAIEGDSMKSVRGGVGEFLTAQSRLMPASPQLGSSLVDTGSSGLMVSQAPSLLSGQASSTITTDLPQNQLSPLSRDTRAGFWGDWNDCWANAVAGVRG